MPKIVVLYFPLLIAAFFLFGPYPLGKPPVKEKT
jgi:hypothetical protein